jgi:hypothetical protein
MFDHMHGQYTKKTHQGADAVVPDFSKVTLSTIFDPLFAGETEILSKYYALVLPRLPLHCTAT